MADKLQQKFALVQQMKREKELREAKAKEHKPIDIFAIAGVNLAGPGHHAVSRHDSASPRPPLPRRQSTSTSVGGSALKRPHPERSVSISSDRSVPETAKAISADSNSPPASVLPSNDQDGESQAGKKLKRSSMARGASTTSSSAQRRPSGGSNTGLQSPTHCGSNRRLSTSMPSAPLPRNSSTSSSAASPGYDAGSPTSATATPPTPIPSPRGAKEDAASSQSSAHHSHQRFPPRTEMYHGSQSLECPEGISTGAYARTQTQPRHLSSDENSEDEHPHILSHPSARLASDARSPPPRRYSRQESYDTSSQHSYVSRSRSPSRSPRSVSRPRSLSRSDASPFHPYSPHADDYSRYRNQAENQHSYSRRHMDNGYDRDIFRRDSAMTPVSSDPTDPFGVANRCVYVGQLPSSATLDSLQKAFEVFGSIKDVNFVEGVEYGFVTFKEPEAAQRALDKASVSGESVKIGNDSEVDISLKESGPKDNSLAAEGPVGVLVDGVAVEVKRAKLPGSSLESSTGNGAYLNSPPYHARSSSSPSDIPACVPVMKSRSVHQLPSKPRAVVPLPPKPTGAAAFPPALASTSSTEVAKTATLGRARQILSYDDL